MTTREKREYYRIDSQNLLNYISLDENGDICRHGMGRTINVSETGILLETHVPMTSGERLSLTIGFRDDLIDIQGKIVYSKPGVEGKFEAGIHFQNLDEKSQEYLRQYIKSFHEQKLS